MKTKASFLLLGCLMLVLSPMATKAATSSFINEGKINGVMVASGGVGRDERAVMAAMAKNYNLKLVFAEAPNDFIAGVEVKIEDHSGKMILETLSNGPWFFARFPRGNCRVIADFRHHRKTRDLTVATGLETVEFFWKA